MNYLQKFYPDVDIKIIIAWIAGITIISAHCSLVT